jgi:hypothetical protein
VPAEERIERRRGALGRRQLAFDPGRRGVLVFARQLEELDAGHGGVQAFEPVSHRVTAVDAVGPQDDAQHARAMHAIERAAQCAGRGFMREGHAFGRVTEALVERHVREGRDLFEQIGDLRAAVRARRDERTRQQSRVQRVRIGPTARTHPRIEHRVPQRVLTECVGRAERLVLGQRRFVFGQAQAQAFLQIHRVRAHQRATQAIDRQCAAFGFRRRQPQRGRREHGRVVDARGFFGGSAPARVVAEATRFDLAAGVRGTERRGRERVATRGARSAIRAPVRHCPRGTPPRHRAIRRPASRLRADCCRADPCRTNSATARARPRRTTAGTDSGPRRAARDRPCAIRACRVRWRCD